MWRRYRARHPGRGRTVDRLDQDDRAALDEAVELLAGQSGRGWNSPPRGIVNESSSLVHAAKLLLEVCFAPCCRLLGSLDGAAPVASRPERSPAVRGARSEAGQLLHRALDGEADGPHRLVDAFDGVDGAVACLAELVELGVDAIQRASDLADHGQQLALRSPDQRGEAAEG